MCVVDVSVLGSYFFEKQSKKGSAWGTSVRLGCWLWLGTFCAYVLVTLPSFPSRLCPDSWTWSPRHAPSGSTILISAERFQMLKNTFLSCWRSLGTFCFCCVQFGSFCCLEIRRRDMRGLVASRPKWNLFWVYWNQWLIKQTKTVVELLFVYAVRKLVSSLNLHTRCLYCTVLHIKIKC